jgi:hypothetical protein
VLQQLMNIGEIVAIIFLVWIFDPIERENPKPSQDRAWRRNRRGKRFAGEANVRDVEDLARQRSQSGTLEEGSEEAVQVRREGNLTT